MSKCPLLILWEALAGLLGCLSLKLLDWLFTFKFHQGSQLLCEQIQILSLVRLKLKEGLDLRFLDVHDLDNLLLFLLGEILHINGSETLDRVRALREHWFDPLDKLRLPLQTAQFI